MEFRQLAFHPKFYALFQFDIWILLSQELKHYTNEKIEMIGNTKISTKILFFSYPECGIIWAF